MISVARPVCASYPKREWINGTVATWGISSAFLAATAAALLAHQGTLVRLAFPAGALVVAVYLFRKDTAAYISFAWWLWFLSPLVRRLADFQGGWMETNPVMLTPLLAALVPVVQLHHRASLLTQAGGRPFLITLAAVAYGTAVGIMRLPAGAVLSHSLTWFSPIIFGFGMLCTLSEYPACAERILSTFRWSVLLVGLYGVLQFVVLPGWDEYWMTQSGLLTIGFPEPYLVRVFSTLNTPTPLGEMMVAGLLLLAADIKPAGLIAGVAGCLSLLLCQSRASWLGMVAGLIVLLCSLSWFPAGKILLLIALLAGALVPVLTFGPFASTVRSRFESLTNLQHDVSRIDRMKGYEKLLNVALHEPFGKGIGAMDIEFGGEGGDEGGPHDSGILEILLSLGWFGAATYFTGLGLLLYSSVRNVRTLSGANDRFAVASNAIFVALIAQIALVSVMIGVIGAILWSFGAVSFAARRYHRDFVVQ
jgi:hypothetical protein